MKRVFIILIFVSFIINIFSCEKESISKEARIPWDKDAIINIGIAHNQHADRIYEVLQRNKLITRAEEGEYTCIDAISDIAVEAGRIMLEDNVSKDEINNMLILLTNTYVDNSVKQLFAQIEGKDMHIWDYIDDSLRSALTYNEQAILEKIDVIFLDEDNDIESLHNRLNQIENEVNNGIFSEDETLNLLGALSIAKNSLSYWKENVNKWESEFSESIVTRGKFRDWWRSVGAWWREHWKAIALVDVTGFLLCVTLSAGWAITLGVSVGSSLFCGGGDAAIPYDDNSAKDSDTCPDKDYDYCPDTSFDISDLYVRIKDEIMSLELFKSKIQEVTLEKAAIALSESSN